MEQKKIKNLSMSGGGVYGFAELGVLKELEKYGQYLDIQNIKGVSVGSIVAALYAIGYTADELTKILFDMNLDNLIMDTYFTTIHLYNNYGMHASKGLEEEVERLISMKTNIKQCTFSQIDKNLTIIATNLNYQCPKFFDKENTPNVPISKAIRLSTAYPIVMTPVLFEGDLICDGGAFLNYPIITVPDDELDLTIGITFSAHNENLNGSLSERCQINNIYEYIATVGMTMTRSMYLAQVTEKYLNRSVVVKISEKINSIQFNLTPEQKKYIYQCGINSAREQISTILNVPPIVEELIENPIPTSSPVVEKPIENPTPKSDTVESVENPIPKSNAVLESVENPIPKVECLAENSIPKVECLAENSVPASTPNLDPIENIVVQ